MASDTMLKCCTCVTLLLQLISLLLLHRSDTAFIDADREEVIDKNRVALQKYMTVAEGILLDKLLEEDIISSIDKENIEALDPDDPAEDQPLSKRKKFTV